MLHEYGVVCKWNNPKLCINYVYISWHLNFTHAILSHTQMPCLPLESVSVQIIWPFWPIVYITTICIDTEEAIFRISLYSPFSRGRLDYLLVPNCMLLAAIVICVKWLKWLTWCRDCFIIPPRIHEIKQFHIYHLDNQTAISISPMGNGAFSACYAFLLQQIHLFLN